MQRLLLILVAIVAAGFGAWSFQSSNPDSKLSTEVHATDLSGEAVDIRATQGKKKLINFWASWCTPCVVELPLIESYAADNAQHLDVLAVAIDTLPHTRDFLEKHPLNLPIAVGNAFASELMIEWGNDKSALPFSAMLDAEGNLLKVHLGPFDQATLSAFVSE